MRTALQYAGQCTVPSILLTLGANLHAAIEEAFPGQRGGVNEPLVDQPRDKEQAAQELQISYKQATNGLQIRYN